MGWGLTSILSNSLYIPTGPANEYRVILILDPVCSHLNTMLLIPADIYRYMMAVGTSISCSSPLQRQLNLFSLYAGRGMLGYSADGTWSIASRIDGLGGSTWDMR
jgi:hypothetical protein